MNLDLTEIERETYSLLDAASAIGGLFGLVTSLLAALVPWFATSDVSSDLGSRLYRQKHSEDDYTQSRPIPKKERWRCCGKKTQDAMALKDDST